VAWQEAARLATGSKEGVAGGEGDVQQIKSSLYSAVRQEDSRIFEDIAGKDNKSTPNFAVQGQKINSKIAQLGRGQAVKTLNLS